MPSTVARQASSRMLKVAAEIQKATRNAVARAALTATNTIRGEIRKDVPSGVLRGVGQKGAKVGAGFDVKGTRNPTALVRARGPLHLVENPSKAHDITPKKRRGKKALRTPYGPKASVHHPGVRRPRGPWKRALPRAEREAVKQLDKGYIEAFRRGAR